MTHSVTSAPGEHMNISTYTIDQGPRRAEVCLQEADARRSVGSGEERRRSVLTGAWGGERTSGAAESPFCGVGVTDKDLQPVCLGLASPQSSAEGGSINLIPASGAL